MRDGECGGMQEVCEVALLVVALGRLTGHFGV